MMDKYLDLEKKKIIKRYMVVLRVISRALWTALEESCKESGKTGNLRKIKSDGDNRITKVGE